MEESIRFDLKKFQVRRYRDSDRAAVRALCCDTGFLGKPIDPVFEDRELFADFLTGYYLKHEPDSAFVVSANGVVRGYLLGSRYPVKHQFWSFTQNVLQASRMLGRYWRYNRESRRFIHWIISKAWREVPAAPRTIGHFHINLLPEIRSIAVCRQLLETYFRFLRNHGVKKIHAQIVTFDGRRGFKFLERYGFRVLNQSEITKYRRFTNQSVYLCTIVKELDERSDRLLYPMRG
jgi:ribosomal protein S18 acetylase RimI-like enzyme